MILNILLIANQQRLQQLVSNAALSLGHSLTIATNLADGSSAISASPPSLLFLQSRLSGLSADIITRHFRAQKSASKSKIILLAESASEINAGETQADIIFDAGLTDDDLLAEINKLLAEFEAPSSTGKKKRSKIAAPANDTFQEPVAASDEASATHKQRARIAEKPKSASRKPKTALVNSELDAMLESFHQELEGALKRPTAEIPPQPPEQTHFEIIDVVAEKEPESNAIPTPTPPAPPVIEPPLPTEPEVTQLSGEDVTDTFSSGPEKQPAETPPIKFQEELDTLLGTPAQPEAPLSSPVHEPTITGLTVEEVLLRPPPQSKSSRGTWVAAVIAAIAMGIGVYFIIDSPTGLKNKISPLPAATSSDGKPSSMDQQHAPATAIAQKTQKNIEAPDGKSSLQITKPATAQFPAGAPHPAEQTGIGPTTKLPRFIPAEALVKTDTTLSPGWERYVTSTAEFKVFREKSAIKALQIIDRTGKGFSKAYFTSVIGEIAGTRDYRLESKEKKGDYLIKKGRLSGNSRVILYKKNSDTLLQAFVIYFE